MKKDFINIKTFAAALIAAACPFFAHAQEAPAVQTFEAGKKAVIKAENIKCDRTTATAYGNAEILYKGSVLKADQIIYDEVNRTITMYGNVRINKDGSELKADYGTYGLDDESSEFFNVEGSTDEVDHDGKKIQGKVYFWGDRMVKTEKCTKIDNAVITTCDCPRPELHYHIHSKIAEIYPGQKIIARHSKLKIKDKTLLGYSRLEFKLGKKQQSLIPTIGNNSHDGWYVKKNFDVNLFGNEGTGHIDLYQKSGIGFGLKYPYALGKNGYGYLDYYNLSPSKTAIMTENLTNEEKKRQVGKKELRNDIRYDLGNGYYTGLNIGMYDYQYPGEKTSNWNNYNYYFGRNTKKQAIYFEQTATDYNTYSYQTRKLDFGQKIGDGWTIKAGGFNSGYAGNVESNNSIWRYYTELNYENNFTDATLSYIRSTNNEVYHLDRIPEINVISKNMYIGSIPIKTAFTAGSYSEEPVGLHMERGKIYIGVQPFSMDIGSSGILNAAGGFQQILCGDGSQKYAFSGQAAYTHTVSDHIKVKANYYLQNPKGYSPFVDDYIPSYSMLTAGAEIHNKDYWKLSMYGGYDYMYKTSTSLITTLDMKQNDKMRWIIGANYNMDTHQFPNFTSELKLDLGGGYSVENWMLYDNVNNKLTYMNIGLSKETHDTVTKLLYRNKQKEFWVQFYLKAFPEQPVCITPNSADIISPRK